MPENRILPEQISRRLGELIERRHSMPQSSAASLADFYTISRRADHQNRTAFALTTSAVAL